MDKGDATELSKYRFEMSQSCLKSAKTLLEIGDYKGAAIYFSRLDTKRYPEASDYLRLCRIQTGFDHDTEEAMEVTSRLFTDISSRAPSKMKYENLIFIAGCFENYDEDRTRGLEKALTVLRFAEDELNVAGEDPSSEMNDEDVRKMKARIEELGKVKEKQIKIINDNKMIGDIHDEKNDQP